MSTKSQEIIQKILKQRGIGQSEQAAFLNPSFENGLPDGQLMKGMDQAVQRIQKAMSAKEKIMVFGDYDADGVPATAVVVRAFAGLGVAVTPLIPTRAGGYGLTAEVVSSIQKSGCTLLITVDNGTVAKTEITALKVAGIDTIVCDHHEPQEEQLASAAVAILNPKQASCPYPFKELCGCAIAWKLMREVYKMQGANPERLKWELDLVAFSTIADMVPLLGENRVLTTFGLRVLRKSRNLGLQALATVAGVKLEEVSTGSVGFRLAPRLNAPSRMHQDLLSGEHASLRLLITDSPEEALKLAEFLDQQNSERQSLLEQQLNEAMLAAAEYPQDLCLVLFQAHWSTGVIGLMAGRLVEKCKRPVLILGQEGEEVKGSMRTVDGVHALSLMEAVQDQLSRFGGHARAGGLSLKTGETSVSLVRQGMHNWLSAQGVTLENLALACQKKAEITLPLKEATLELAEALAELEPFGIGFPRPLFESTCKLSAVRQVGGGKQHLACFLEQGEERKKAIGFGLGGLEVQEGVEYMVSYNLEVEEWNNNRAASCHIQAII